MAYATPLTPVTGDPPALVPFLAPLPRAPTSIPQREPESEPEPGDTPGMTPMASAPTPMEGVPPPGTSSPEPEATPSHIGRFTVLKRLGSGGMGVVYAAYDPDLDRKVAFKVLRTRVGQMRRETGRARLLREAQAMAKLSHPNVVAIYDVGTLDDQVFLAMEFVKGTTLTKWMQAEKRGWREVLGVFMQAGRGLSAAHRAGIIHRDFKPDNVLIDGEGRVRVVDFGLARADGGSGMFARPDTYADAIKSMSGSSMLDMRITRTGGMTGTPAYMAPEQYLGQPTDGRTDQFSFCVALFEGLYGLRPFIGERVAVVREAVLGGKIQDVPKDSDVPVWLRRILTHGLAVMPGERYRGMDDLLTRLADDPRPPAKRWLAIVGACGLAGLVALAAREWVREPTVAPSPVLALCDADAALADSWSPERRQAVAAAFARSRVPGAEPLAGRVTAVLDAHVQRWREQLAVTCAPIKDEALRLAAEPQVACLSRHLAGLQELSNALIRAEPRTVQRALQAAWALPPPRNCVATAAVSTTPVPEDQARRIELVRAAARSSLGDHVGALEVVRKIVGEAGRAGNLPLQAEALHHQATLERAAGDATAAERSLRAAMATAEACHNNEWQLASATLLLDVLRERGRDEEAGTLWPRLTALLSQHSDDGRAEALALHAIGRLLLRRGRNAEAATQLALALRLGERSLSPEHPQVGGLLLDLATAQARLAAFDEAATQLDRAAKLLHDALPATDPGLMRVYLMRAEVQRHRGKLAEAVADYERAEQILVTMTEPELGARADVQLGLAQVALAQGRLAAAEANFARALALREQEHGKTAAALVEPLIGQCATASRLGLHDAALLWCQRALKTAELPGNQIKLGPAQVAIARALWAQATATGAMTPALRVEILRLARIGLEALQHTAHPDPNAIADAAGWIATHASG